MEYIRFQWLLINLLVVAHLCPKWINFLSQVGQKDGRGGANLCPSSVDRVDIKHKYTEQVESLVCDSLIFSKGFIPSTFFLKGTGIALNDKLYVVTDHAGKTSVDNILAFGHCTDHHEVSCEQIESSMKRLFA